MIKFAKRLGWFLLEGSGHFGASLRRLVFLRQCRRDAELTQRFSKSLGLDMLDTRTRRVAKSRDVLFILASGESVNELTPENIDQIGAGVSIGINFWPIHSFVPDILALEPHKSEPSSDFLNALLNSSRLEQSELRVMMLRSGWPIKEETLPKLPEHLAKETKIYGRANMITKMQPNLFTDLGRLVRATTKGELPSMILPDNGSTVVRLTFYGLAQGFRKIVWVGVDQSSGHYFWTQPPIREEYRSAALAEPRPVGAPHSTSETSDRPFSNDVFLRALAKVIAYASNTEIFLASATSTLSDTIPVFPWTGGPPDH